MTVCLRCCYPVYLTESRNITLVEDRLYFTTDDPEEGLVEYDLNLLGEFISAGMAADYKPRVLFTSQVADFDVESPRQIDVLTQDGTVKRVKSLLGRAGANPETKLEEEAYPGLVFTKICRIRELAVTASHDDDTNIVVFHLIDKNFDLVSSAWVLPQDEQDEEEEGNTASVSVRSAHVHTMKTVRLHNADYVLAGSYTAGLHLICCVNMKLHLLLQSQHLAPSGLCFVRGMIPLIQHRESNNALPSKQDRGFAVFGELLGTDGED